MLLFYSGANSAPRSGSNSCGLDPYLDLTPRVAMDRGRTAGRGKSVVWPIPNATGYSKSANQLEVGVRASWIEAVICGRGGIGRTRMLEVHVPVRVLEVQALSTEPESLHKPWTGF